MIDMSVTSMSHQIISSLSGDAFDDLCALACDGSCCLYSFDQFRRLYNDAVESMQAYKDLSARLMIQLEEARDCNNELQQCLMEYADIDMDSD